MVVDGLTFAQGRIRVVGGLGWLGVLVCTHNEEDTEVAHAWCVHNQGRDSIQIASGTFC